jgi:hypothetical protein
MYGGGYYTSPRVHCEVCGKLNAYKECTECATKRMAKEELMRPEKVAID